MSENLELELIRAVIASYHTTRLSEVSAETHVRSKPAVRKALDALLSARAPQAGEPKPVSDEEIANTIYRSVLHVFEEVSEPNPHDYLPAVRSVRHLFAHPPKADPDVVRLVEALKECVAWMVELANSGDAGFWDPEKTPEIIQARAALAPFSALSGEG